MREVAIGGHGDSLRTVVGLVVGATGRALPPRWGGLWLVSVAGVILFAAALMLPFAVWPEASMCIAAAVVNWRSVILRVAVVGATGCVLLLRRGVLGLVTDASIILFAAALMLPCAVWPDASIRIAAAVVDWRSVILRVADHCGRQVLALGGAAAVDRGRLARGRSNRG
jgi:hypothetical protein